MVTRGVPTTTTGIRDPSTQLTIIKSLGKRGKPRLPQGKKETGGRKGKGKAVQPEKKVQSKSEGKQEIRAAEEAVSR